MGNLTKNISRHELKCHCGKCKCDAMDFETINIVQDVCDHFAEKLDVEKVVLDVRSAHRCDDHNAAVGGVSNSFHKLAKAMDIAIDGISPEKIYNYLDQKYPKRLGLGLYRDFVHVDSRAGKARW